MHLFPTTAWRFRIDPNSYDKARLVREATENFRRDPYRNKWANDGTLHHCYDDWDNPNFIKYDFNKMNLVQIYQPLVHQFTNSLNLSRQINYSFEIVNVTVNGPKQYMGVHNHVVDTPNKTTCFVGVHYIKLLPHQPSTTFMNPIGAAAFPTFFNYARGYFSDESHDTSSYQQQWEINTQEDDLIIFPSYLNHKIRGNWEKLSPTEPERITVAINIDFLKDEQN